MTYYDLTTEINKLLKKVCFITNHPGYKIGVDTKFESKDIDAYKLYEDSFIVFVIKYRNKFSDTDVGVHEFDLDLLSKNEDEINEILQKNVDEYEKYLNLKNKFE